MDGDLLQSPPPSVPASQGSQISFFRVHRQHRKQIPDSWLLKRGLIRCYEQRWGGEGVEYLPDDISDLGVDALLASEMLTH